MPDRAAKPTDYYATLRTDILPLLHGHWPRALEIGCGAGVTLRHLKDRGYCDWIAGVEPSAAAADAATRLDQVFDRPVEALLEAGALPRVELILCLDVLEHLIDPWSVTAQLAALLPPGGTFVASLPNLRYHRVLFPLLFAGKWEYAESGIMDVTHLRFFTRSSAVAMLEGAGLRVEEVRGNTVLKPWKNKWILNKLSGGRLEDLYALQFLIRARR
jgi:2-polyprenyl-3-methyl-5-hydroxy-6-metoxy-1,4-benzoquinol methylase